VATAIKTWTWDASVESFSLTGGADSSLTRDTGNGSPSNGSLYHVTSGRRKTSAAIPSHADLANVTWEDLGVPSGATITSVQVTDVRTYYGLTDNTVPDTFGPVAVHLYANGTTTDVTGAAPFSRSGSASADGSWQTGSGTDDAVNASYQASTTPLDVYIEFQSINGNNASAATSVHLDYLQFTITYTAAPDPVNSDGAVTLSAITVAAAATESMVGDGAVTLSPISVSAAATESLTGDGAVTLPALTVAAGATHTEPINSDGAVTLPSLTVAAAATESLIGDGAVTLPALTVSGASDQTFSGSGAVTLPALTTSGQATETLSGSAAVTLPALTLDAGATNTPPPLAGDGAVTLPALTVGATGTHTQQISSDGAVTLPALTVSAAGTHQQNISGDGAVTLPALVVGGTGTHQQNVNADGTVTLPGLQINATATAPATQTAGGGDEEDWSGRLPWSLPEVKPPARTAVGDVTLPSLAVSGRARAMGDDVEELLVLGVL
jgi:hypothetical protein